jgi:hypothetical protein
VVPRCAGPDHQPPATPGPTGTHQLEKLGPQAGKSRKPPPIHSAGNPRRARTKINKSVNLWIQA